MRKLLLGILFVSAVFAQIDVDVETGGVFSGYNDVRIPGDSGTMISFSEELTTDPGVFGRLRIGYTFKERHHISALYAPLTLKAEGQVDRDIVFQGETYPANTPLDATYKFNSYRLSYRYDFMKRERLELSIGFTAKIRDARIAIEGGGIEAEKTNVGFVPIIRFRLQWNYTERLALLLDGDALAAPQGRAEDVLLAMVYSPIDRLDLKAGYRIVEGGADNDEVYTFTLINYISIGAIVHF